MPYLVDGSIFLRHLSAKEVDFLEWADEGCRRSWHTRCPFSSKQTAPFLLRNMVIVNYTVVFKLFNPSCIFPVISIVNKLCNIECCVNNMFRINKKMIVSRG